MANEKQPQKPTLAPEHRGEKTYRVGVRHYRQGVVYEPGELITVTDEKPSKTWTLVDTAKEAAKPAAPAATKPQGKRDADNAI